MKAYDVQAKQEIEVTEADLVKFLDNNRQVDLVFSETKSDEDGYMKWDRENWLLVKGRKVPEKLLPRRQSAPRLHPSQHLRPEKLLYAGRGCED